MDGFILNGRFWRVVMVDGGSDALIDRTGSSCLATTDPSAMTVYIDRSLSGDMLSRVLIHEMCHCLMVSYGLIDELHSMVKRSYWVRAEEWVCNLFADYASLVLMKASKVIGDRAIAIVPYALESMVA